MSTPWIYKATAGNHDFLIFPEGPGNAIAVVYGGENEAHAQLIAAAPAMRDTLRAIRARVKGEWDAPELVAKGAQYFQADEDVLKWIDDTLKELAP